MSYTVKANLSENRLYVKIFELTEITITNYLTDFNKEFDKLKPGMTILFDMKDSKVLPPSVVAKTESNKERCIAKGLSKAAMIVQSAILKGQMNRSYNKTADLRDAFFDNMEDALRFLNS